LVNGSFGTAVGQGSSASFTNSTAIGAGATTTRDNQFVLGTSANTYTAPGITSATSLFQQQGNLEDGTIQIVTSDQSGNLATDGGAVFQNFARIDDQFNQTDQRLNNLDGGLNQTNNRVDQLGAGLDQTNNRVDQLGSGLNQANERIDNLSGRVDNLDDRITDNQEGIAMAMAISGVAPLDDYERVGINMNWGTFGGQNAFGMSAIVRLTPIKELTGKTVDPEDSEYKEGDHKAEKLQVYFTGGLGVGFNQGTLGGRAGFGFSF